MKEFTNENRNRYYGVRVGDIVSPRGLDGKSIGEFEVVSYGHGDNNAVYIEKDGKMEKWVAEWCRIVTKVEDRTDWNPNKANAYSAISMLKTGVEHKLDKWILEAYKITEHEDFSWDNLDALFEEWDALVDDANDILLETSN